MTNPTLGGAPAAIPDPDEIAGALRRLGHMLEDLRGTVRGFAFEPGTNALEKLAVPLQTAQTLTTRAVDCLRSLTQSSYASNPYSRSTLTLLASTVACVCVAAAHVSEALAANPADDKGFRGTPEEAASTQAARNAEALPVMTEHLTQAAEELELARIGCFHAASGITGRTRLLDSKATDSASASPKRTRRSTPPARLSPAQQTALRALARDGARLHESLSSGKRRVVTEDGTRITSATLESLRGRQLVHVDNSTSLFHGQRITLTPAGREAAAALSPIRSETTGPAGPPAAPSAAPRR
ncbi:hypothetical protein J5J01_00275 [Streptomyces fradiae]|uniref:hypothetical protein n=1 Tax=Streptomyces fradiae TaxID=1906 RepID=UPI002019868E|nr:hypothetical protein [Streptomyces fradiae]UQS30280.1 hypothetical protein J5J01_00275 [Streptomyces fradiae]